MYTNGHSAPVSKLIKHLFWGVEFHGGFICVVHNFYNNRFWRLRAVWITCEKGHPRKRQHSSFVTSWHYLCCALRDWFESHVVYFDLSCGFCRSHTWFSWSLYELLPGFGRFLLTLKKIFPRQKLNLWSDRRAQSWEKWVKLNVGNRQTNSFLEALILSGHLFIKILLIAETVFCGVSFFQAALAF